MIYGIILFGLRKGSRIHGRGFGFFPKCSGARTLYLGQGVKPTGFKEGAKGSFVEAGGQRPGTLAFGARRHGPWRLVLKSEKDSCLAG